jgi:hypothetical protein
MKTNTHGPRDPKDLLTDQPNTINSKLATRIHCLPRMSNAVTHEDSLVTRDGLTGPPPESRVTWLGNFFMCTPPDATKIPRHSRPAPPVSSPPDPTYSRTAIAPCRARDSCEAHASPIQAPRLLRDRRAGRPQIGWRRRQRGAPCWRWLPWRRR